MSINASDKDAFAAYVDHVDVDYATEESFEEVYCGEWGSDEEYGENLFDDLYSHEVPDHLTPYIDYTRFARDLFICGDYFSVKSDSGVYVFRDC